MSGEEEDMWKFDDWSLTVDFPRDGLWGDLISDANIDLFIPIIQPPSFLTRNLSDLLQHINTTSTPAGNTTSLSTSACLSLLAKYRSDLESESIELQKLGDEAQLVCLKLSIMKEVLLDLAKCPSGKLKLLLQEAETLKPILAFMIEETMTNLLWFLIESTTQYALSQISATVENLHQSAFTTSLQPLVLDPHNNELHRCKIATLMYMFSLDSGMVVDCGHHSHAFKLKLPF